MIEVKNLTIKYKSSKENVFENISFKVEKGEVLVILGPSGCGKTTLLKYVNGILDDRDVEVRGDVLFDDFSRKDIRMVFQSPILFPWRTVEKNISLGLESSDSASSEVNKEINEVIKIIGLEDYKNFFPNKISIGMQQRVNFARAIVCSPDLLLLDEPFSALDVHTKKRLQKKFLKIIRDRKITCIFVTHSIEEALEIGDKVYTFFDGKKLKKGLYENKFKNIEKEKLYIKAEEYLHECR